MLRQIMTEEIRAYGWLDYVWQTQPVDKYNCEEYEIYLYSLDDRDFLWRYNDMREIINNLD